MTEVSTSSTAPTALTDTRVWDQDSLIEALDPDRNYGDDVTLVQIAKQIRDGKLRIGPPPEGTEQPLLFDAKSGKRVKGSGVPIPKGRTQEARLWSRARFNERAAEDLDAVYDSLVKAAVGTPREPGDPRAMKLFLEMFLGPPTAPPSNQLSELVTALLMAAQTPQATVYTEVGNEMLLQTPEAEYSEAEPDDLE